MPGWAIIAPDDWELYERDMEEVSRFWNQAWMDILDSDIANNYA